jgi:hypothetical protein
MEIHTKEHIKMVSLMGMGSIIGQTEAFTKDSSKMDYEMEEEFGKNQMKQMLRCMRVNSRTRKSKDMECLVGQMGVNILAISQTI